MDVMNDGKKCRFQADKAQDHRQDLYRRSNRHLQAEEVEKEAFDLVMYRLTLRMGNVINHPLADIASTFFNKRSSNPKTISLATRVVCQLLRICKVVDLARKVWIIARRPGPRARLNLHVFAVWETRGVSW